MIQITRVDVTLLPPGSNVLAYVFLVIDDAIVIRWCRITKSETGRLHLGWPLTISPMSRNTVVHCFDRTVKARIEKMALARYLEALCEESASESESDSDPPRFGKTKRLVNRITPGGAAS